jgi:hypothetical protein
MRLLLATALLIAGATPAAGRADEPGTLVLQVGARAVVGGSAGRCDDLSVATITQDADATITALKVGTTLCSSKPTGPRQILRVVVEERGK